MNRQSRALLTILLVASVGLTTYFCRQSVRQTDTASNTSPAAPAVPTRGGAIVVSARSEPRSFNPLITNDFPFQLFWQLTLGRLVRINRATQEVEPQLAEKWTLAADGRTYTLTLRDGVTWSDGTPFTSADVVFTFEAAYAPAVNSYLSSSFRVNWKPLTVTAPDARTVVIVYPEPYAPGLAQLDNLPIAPKHKLEAALRNGTLPKAWGPATPPGEIVGLGPFTLARLEPGQRVVYERNPRYWRKDERGVQLPYLDRVTIELIPDQDAEVVRLQAGQLDFTNQQLRAGDIAALRQLANQGKLQMMELGVSTDPDSFFFNLRPAYWAKDPRRGWLPRKEFRQAISHAVDREGFANTVFLGEAVPINGPITPGNQKWFSPNVPRYEFSRDKAKALLEGIGLRNRDGDEWLEDEAGTEARFTLQVFKGNTVLERIAAVVRDDLRQVGIAADLAVLEANTVIERITKGQFDAAVVAFQSNLDPAINKDFWFSTGANHLWNPSQVSPATEWEREIDALMAKNASTLDEAERRRLFNEVQRLFAENLPILYFASPRIHVAAQPRVFNLTPAVSRPQLLWSADTIAVRQN